MRIVVIGTAESYDAELIAQLLSVELKDLIADNTKDGK